MGREDRGVEARLRLDRPPPGKRRKDELPEVREGQDQVGEELVGAERRGPGCPLCPPGNLGMTPVPTTLHP